MRKLIPCKNCGKLFEPKPREIYCSAECRKEVIKAAKRYQMYQFEKPKAEKPKKKRKSQLDAINAEARKLGMTYGQYQAMKYVKEGGIFG